MRITLKTGKMVKIRLWKLLFLLFQIFMKTFATSHWVVTENGRIQSHLDSPFYLRRPYDLITLLDQETRRTNINTIYNDLLNRKDSIDKKWSGLEGASDLEARIYSQDPDCLKASKLLNEIDLYASIGSNGSNRAGIKYETINEQHANPIELDCTKYSDLDFSMFAYEHLHAMINRRDIVILPESNLEYLLPVPSVTLFGNEIAYGLAKNHSSWLHYNLGILYWRIKGNALKAIECGRRALYFTPRIYKDIPLLNLAGIFHQARFPKDAAILLHAAIEHAPLQPANYLALGNVYATLSDYNRSIACYDNVLNLQPGLENVITTKYATLCHKRLDSGLIELHESLQGILTDLHDYHTQQQQWLRLQERLMWEQAPLEAQLLGYNSEKLSALLANRGQRCIQRISENSKPTITCDFTDHQAVTNLQVDVTLNLQRLLRNVESESQKINEQMARSKRRPAAVKKVLVTSNTYMNDIRLFTDDKPIKNEENAKDKVDNNNNMPETLYPIYPTTFPTSSNLYFDETGWPTKDECTSWNLPLTEPDELDLPVFLPPENKGYQITEMLSSYIDLQSGDEHPLPWYPPLCKPADKDIEMLYIPTSLRHLADTSAIKSNPLLQKHLLKYINEGQAVESEVGQRIVTAMRQQTGPDWVLATLASLYWRIRSNTRNALNCLEFALQNVPKEDTDVILVSIGSVMHQLGLIDDALRFALFAFRVNCIEPSTNFLLALLYYNKNNPIQAMYYMKNVLRVEPNYYNGKAEELLRTWSCRIKTGNYEDIKPNIEKSESMCSEKDTFNGEGVICSVNGEQCKTAEIQCFRAENTHSDSTISRSRLSSQQCTKQNLGLGQSLISTLLAAEGSGGIESDHLQFENLLHNQHQAFHMRISLGDDHTPSGGNTLGDFYVSVSLTDDPVPEAMLHVYDKSGTYRLSPRGCRRIQEIDWSQFNSIWESIAARNIDIGSFLKPIPEILNGIDLKPYCPEVQISPPRFDHYTAMVLNKNLPNAPESSLLEWLGLMADDQSASLRELGIKISIAIQENSTSWILTTASAYYWRVVGNTKEAVKCIRHALTYVPNDMKDIPLNCLANVLHRAGLHTDAVEAANAALKNNPDFIVNHLTIGNIYTSLGDLEKAISFYRSALALDSDFQPARNRLQAILCTLLFDESGSLRDTTDFSDN